MAWSDLWKAWLANVAERFAQRDGPAPPAVQRQPHRGGPAPAPAAAKGARAKPAAHRSGQRHG